ncbi:MAG: SDR family NAD(P)-dependent oxidoreductase [Limnobacter sp.]|nr:SDR family NAD(P)-dependent oxidoreductase [Limnobacter sp.]
MIAGEKVLQLKNNTWQCPLEQTAELQNLLIKLGPFSHVLHLSGLGGAEPRQDNSLSADEALMLARRMIALAQALAHFTHPAKVVFLTEKGQQAKPGEASSLAVGAVMGLPEVFSGELRHCEFKLVDFDVYNQAQAFAELLSLFEHKVIAWRGGERLRLGLKQVDFLHETPQGQPFREGDAVLITGGLGGVGFELAKTMMQRYRVRLLITGRTVLPAREAWPLILAEGGQSATRLERLTLLESLGQVTYCALDVSDEKALKQAVEQFEQTHGLRFSGVVHASGTLAAGGLKDFNPLSLDAALKPKCKGTLAISRVFSAHPSFKFIAISSMAGLLGGNGLAAYSVANAFLTHFVENTREKNAWVVNYGRWDDIGMAQGRHDQEALIAQGYIPLSAQDASQAFLASIERAPASYYYGLEPAGYLVSLYGEQTAYPQQQTSMLSEQELAAQITAVFKNLLELDELNPEANFFDLGVHSLLIPQLKKQLTQQTGHDIPTVEFFRSTTVNTLTQSLLSKQGDSHTAKHVQAESHSKAANPAVNLSARRALLAQRGQQHTVEFEDGE